MRSKRVVAILTVVVLVMFCAVSSADSMHMTYDPDPVSAGNALMGYAPCAWLDPKLIADDVELVYVGITWREWEPEKGQYAVADIVEYNQLKRWFEEGKHVVLRFMCDRPEDDDHMDIPDWLYEETGGAGTHYDMDYGKGFSPDYTNETFIRYHDRTIRKLGEVFGQDGFVSYVQLGSLGHWGEWHVLYAAGIERLPLEDVRDRYIQPYMDSFPNARLMMRRPFSHAAQNGFGMYNDMAGHPEDSQLWFEWIEEGGEFTQTKESNALVPMPDFWKSAPSGGEFTSSLSMKYILKDHLDQTVDLLRRSHSTFLGPKIADSKFPEGYTKVLQTIGYRLHISEVVLTEQEDGTRLDLVWENNGIAPMYFDWKVKACVLDNEGRIVEAVDVPIVLPEVLPESSVECSVSFQMKNVVSLIKKGWRIGIGIVDPMTGKFAVRIDTLAERYNDMLFLF